RARAAVGRGVCAGAAGPPVAVVWRTGRDVRGSALDGTGARPLLRLPDERGVGATPSPDGRHVALSYDDRLLVSDLDAGGAVRDLGAVARDADVVRWAPDGRRIAVVADERLIVCEAGPERRGCRVWARGVSAETGASWSPDGTGVVVVRQVAGRRGGDEDLVVTTTDGATSRDLDRLRPRGSRFPYPYPPVWARPGPAWTVLDLRLKDGELAGILRSRVRAVRDGAARTLSSVSLAHTNALPFFVAAERPDGVLLGIRERYLRKGAAYDLRTIDPAGRFAPAGLVLGSFRQGMEDEDVDVHGVLADGRVAVTLRPPDTRRLALHLGTSGGGLGPVVRRGDEIAVATAFPGNPVGD
ncbi:hypothetical protein AB0L40_05575, partial [Patulibacter sp. NPDC049589]